MKGRRDLEKILKGRCGYPPEVAAEWDTDENKGVHLPVDE